MTARAVSLRYSSSGVSSSPIAHHKLIGLINSNFELGLLNASIAQEQGVKILPCLLCGLAHPDVRKIHGGGSRLDHVQGGCIELEVDTFSRSQVTWINRTKSLLYNFPQVSARAIYEIVFEITERAN